MNINKKNVIRATLLISIICMLFINKESNKFVQTTYGEELTQEISNDVSSIKLSLSSDDVRYLNDEENDDLWRKVKMFKDNKKHKINIKNGCIKDEAYQIRIDDIVYHLYKINSSTVERYSFLKSARLKGIDTTSPQIVELYFNEVPMGNYIKEEVIYEQIRDSDENYFITLNGNSDYIRKLGYYIENEFEDLLNYFNKEELANYMSFYEMFSDNKHFDFDKILFKYSSSTNKLKPFLTMNTNLNTSDYSSLECNNLIHVLEDDYEFMKILNDKRISNLEDTDVIKAIGDIYYEFNNITSNLNGNYYILNQNYESRLKDIYSLVEEFNTRDPYHKTVKQRFELNGKWEYLKASHSGGFYEEEFELIFEAPIGCKVYYTLDGREPSDKDYLYTKPIKIESRMGEENILSNINDISTEWKKPRSESFKATVIRSVVYYDEKPVSKVMTNTYFVHKNIKDRFKLPVISIVTNPDNFFGFENGIYVLGRSRANWISRNPNTKPGRGTSANYTRRGAEWERPIHMEWFEPNGKLGFSQNLGVRINGGWSRSYPLKPLKIYARKDYDTKGKIKYEIFPNLKETVNSEKTIMEYDTFLLRNSGHDFLKTMFKDAMIQSLMQGTKVDIQGYRPAVTFIDGEYWGIYNVRERQDEAYIESHYEIPKDEVVILENHYRVKSGNNNDMNHFVNMINYIKNNDIADNKVYDYIKTQMDIENFIDYNIIQIYIANGDWPFNNVKYWRKRIEGSEESSLYGHDGKWRWLLFDTDSGFQFTYRMSLSFATKGDEDWASVLLRNLLKNRDFKNQFISRFGDLLNTNLNSDNIIDKIDTMKSVIESEMGYHIDRWNTGGGSIESWNEYVEDLREFARLRSHYVRKDIVSFFNLEGTVEGNFQIPKEVSGDIYINNNKVNDTKKFNGTYFKYIPITITTVPKEGYTFIGWEGSITESEKTITFIPVNDFNIIAKFEKIE